MTAALPFLKCAESVEILSVSRNQDEPIDSSELKTYLQLQGVTASERKVDAGTRESATFCWRKQSRAVPDCW